MQLVNYHTTHVEKALVIDETVDKTVGFFDCADSDVDWIESTVWRRTAYKAIYFKKGVGQEPLQMS